MRIDLQTLTDHELLSRHRAGDKRAFEVIYLRYFNRLVRVARCAGSPDPEDVALTALMRAASSGSGPDNCSFITWSAAIVRNIVTDDWRGRNRLKRPAMAPEVAGSTDPADFETLNVVHAALASMPPEQAHVLKAHYFEGLSAVEISTQLHLSENTVKGRIRLGAAKVRKALTSEDC